MHEASSMARKFAALVDMGLERVHLSPVTTESVRIDRRTHKVICSRPAMGTLVSVTALGRSDHKIQEAIGRAFDEMDRLIGVFSRFDGSSAVTHLNKAGRVAGPPPEFSKVISRSLQYNRLSGGAFDISVEPVVELFRARMDQKNSREPSQAELREALELVDPEGIRLSKSGVCLNKAGMGITLDGIAKGYVVDAIAGVLQKFKIRNYLINAGGDIRTAGTKENRQPWSIAVQDPDKQGRFPDTIQLNDGAVATSGSYEVYFDRDRIFHHIVSSNSGRSPNTSASVSVVAPSAMAADALATSVFVMGSRSGIELIESLPGCECLLVDREGSQLKSTGWRSAANTNRANAES
jgi:thiamine biosynthesis lipoprotein